MGRHRSTEGEAELNHLGPDPMVVSLVVCRAALVSTAEASLHPAGRGRASVLRWLPHGAKSMAGIASYGPKGPALEGPATHRGRSRGVGRTGLPHTGGRERVRDLSCDRPRQVAGFARIPFGMVHQTRGIREESGAGGLAHRLAGGRSGGEGELGGSERVRWGSESSEELSESGGLLDELEEGVVGWRGTGDKSSSTSRSKSAGSRPCGGEESPSPRTEPAVEAEVLARGSRAIVGSIARNGVGLGRPS